LGPISAWAAAPFGWLAGLSLEIVGTTIETAGNWSWGHAWVPGPSAWWNTGLYAGVAACVILPGIRPPRRWALALLGGWVAVGVAPSLAARLATPRLTCTVCAVGHGSSVLVEFPQGGTLLVDAGSLGSGKAAADAIANVLWSRGRIRLDGILLSHEDQDHLNALPILCEKFGIGRVYMTPAMAAGDTPTTRRLHDLLADRGIPVEAVWAGARLTFGDEGSLEILHPPRGGLLGSDNANSLVVLVEWRGRRILLPGDLESPGLEDVLAEEPVDCDVVLAPHHGSAGSDPVGFAAWTTPEVVLVSGNDPTAARTALTGYTQQGARIWHTAADGCLQVVVERGTGDTPRGALTVTAFREVKVVE